MRKPKNKKEAILRKMLEEVDEMNHLTDQQKRAEKRKIKRQISKSERNAGKRELQDYLDDVE